MATWKNLPLLLLLGLSLLAVSATARPCKTLFFFTSTSYYPIPTTTTTTTTTTTHSSDPNPNFSLQQYPSPRFLTFFFTPTHLRSDGSEVRFREPSFVLGRNAIFFDRVGEEDRIGDGDEAEEGMSKGSSSMIPVEFYSSVTSSIRDRTKDIMRVMGAMLFGVGCGALTAATMYLIWSLFWPTSFDFEDSDDDFDDGDEDASPKKIGYVVLPTKVVDDDLKKPAKEVV